MSNKTVLKILVENDIKVTPQRTAILEVIITIGKHPTADEISDYLRISQPNISLSTIYKTLELFAAKGIISKVFSEDNETHYEAVMEKHHHLYCTDNDQIEDYYDDTVTELVNAYFTKKEIPGFEIKDIRLHISGRFTDKAKYLNTK